MQGIWKAAGKQFINSHPQVLFGTRGRPERKRGRGALWKTQRK